MFIISVCLSQIVPLSSQTLSEIPFLGGKMLLCRQHFLDVFVLRVWLEDIYGWDSDFRVWEEKRSGQWGGGFARVICIWPPRFQQLHRVGEIYPLGDVTALVKISFYSLAASAVLMIAVSHVRAALMWVELSEDCKVSTILRLLAPEEDGMTMFCAMVFLCSFIHWFTARCFPLAQGDISTYKKENIRENAFIAKSLFAKVMMF